MFGIIWKHTHTHTDRIAAFENELKNQNSVKHQLTFFTFLDRPYMYILYRT